MPPLSLRLEVFPLRSHVSVINVFTIVASSVFFPSLITLLLLLLDDIFGGGSGSGSGRGVAPIDNG